MNFFDSSPEFLHIGTMIALIGLVGILMIGLWRAWIGPTIEDRFTAVLLLGSGGVSILLLLGSILQLPALFDVSLVLALLSVVISVALTRLGRSND